MNSINQQLGNVNAKLFSDVTDICVKDASDMAGSDRRRQYITSSTMMNIQSWHSITAISLASATTAITGITRKRLRKQTRAENRLTID